MKIVADMSLYPLKDGPVPDIIEFIRDLQAQAGTVPGSLLARNLSLHFDPATLRF